MHHTMRLVLVIVSSLLLARSEAIAPSAARPALHASVASKSDHEIKSLPGFDGELPSRHFGGYIAVDEAQNRNLYYYMVESENSPDDDPVVLWLNGGPGCSSFDGFMYEHGPFYFNWTDHTYSAVQLTLNPHSWSKAATMIYLDSPSPVGLSYSLDESDYTTNDTATAHDSNVFLRRFFKRYPHLQHRDFYITGESYAGVYVPTLAREVVQGNARGDRPHINLKGYIVGNGVTDPYIDGGAFPPFAVGKSLISTQLFIRIQRACDPSSSLPLLTPEGIAAAAQQPQGKDNKHKRDSCDKLLQEMQNELADLNLYNVLEECHYKPKVTPSLAAVQQLQAAGRKQAPLFTDAASALRTWTQWPVRSGIPQGSRVLNWGHVVGLNPPCTLAGEGDLWLNTPEVRQALHAAPVEVAGPWVICSDRINYTHELGSMIPIHDELTTKHGLRALIFSGDHDLCVPHTGSEAWTRGLGRPTVSPWQPWFIGQPKQVAGYVVEYKHHLTYATVKGAGHMVPQTRPEEALAMFRRFISGESLTSRS